MSATENWLLPNACQDGQSITKDWQPASLRLIEGVAIHEVRPVLTGYGHLTEVLRSEWLPDNKKVDQVFASTIQPGGLSAWHAHGMTTDRLFALAGEILVVLFDNRADSPTHGLINEIRLGTQRPSLVTIPPKVWHGVQNTGNTSAVLLNAVDRAYRYDGPDHWRVAPDAPDVPYIFKRLRWG